MTVTPASNPMAMRAALVPTMPPPSTTTRPTGTPGTPLRRVPRPPCFQLEAVGTGLNGHAPGDLAHRSEQRQAATIIGDGLIGNGDATRVLETACQFRIGSQMEIGEQHLVLPQHGHFGRQWFLDLYDDVGTSEYLLRAVQDSGAGGLVGAVLEADLLSATLLDDDLVPMEHQFPRGGRSHSDPVFMRLGLFWNTDSHFVPPVPGAARNSLPRRTRPDPSIALPTVSTIPPVVTCVKLAGQRRALSTRLP